MPRLSATFSASEIAQAMRDDEEDAAQIITIFALDAADAELASFQEHLENEAYNDATKAKLRTLAGIILEACK